MLRGPKKHGAVAKWSGSGLQSPPAAAEAPSGQETGANRDPGRPETAPPEADAGQSRGNADAVETALADALTKATAAGEWTLVGQLARELGARREARTVGNVVALRRRG